jgi:hypothetical protein
VSTPRGRGRPRLHRQLFVSNGLVEISTKRDNIRLLQEAVRVRPEISPTRVSGQWREAGKAICGEAGQERNLRTARSSDAGTHTVSRCAQCGALLTSISEPVRQCPKCKFELHSCRQCTYFDTSSRFECTQPVPERVARKDERNQCTFYSMRVRVEKETSTPSSARPMDARAAFENLFKK